MKNYKFDRLFDREIKKDKKKYRMKVGFLKAATLLGSISAVSFVNFAIAWSNYNKTFGKRIDLYSYPFGGYLIDDFPNLKYEDRNFITSKGITLRGRLFTQKQKSKETKSLIIFSHGLGPGYDGYIGEIDYLVQSGYDVFAYYNTGTGKSGGESIVGFPQSVIDLSYALDYVLEDRHLRTLPLGLYGHSWGAYAVMNVLNLDYPIRAVVERSGPVSSKRIMRSVAINKAGRKAIPLLPFISYVENLKTGKIHKLNAIDGINKSDAEILLMHSEDDEVVPIDTSPFNYLSRIKNPKVRTMLFSNKGHHVVKSNRGLKYSVEKNKEYNELSEKYNGEIPYEEKEKFGKSVDNKLYFELDFTVMQDITNFYDEVFDKKKIKMER